jgi:hypothetical protein
LLPSSLFYLLSSIFIVPCTLELSACGLNTFHDPSLTMLLPFTIYDFRHLSLRPVPLQPASLTRFTIHGFKRFPAS